MYITGFCCQNSKNFDFGQLHAYSLIKLNNKWYPFDSTWGIFTGKLHVGHVFKLFDIKIESLQGSDFVSIMKDEMQGEFIK